MKKALLFIVAIIVAISPILGQTKNVSKAQKVAMVKPIGGRLNTRAEFDSLKAKLFRLDDSQPVTAGMLRKAMSYIHDAALKDGHKEYVSMPGFFGKNQVINATETRLNALSEDVGATAFKVDAVTEDLNVLSDDVGETVVKVDATAEAVKTVEINLNKASNDVGEVIVKVDAATAKVDATVEAVKTVEINLGNKIDEVVINLNEAITNIEAVMAQIKEDVARRRGDEVRLE